MIDGDMLRIKVVDDGVGLAGPSIGVGTRAMFERAAEVGGELTIEDGPVGGSRLVALLLVPQPARGR